MATISNASHKIEAIAGNDTAVKVTVTYTLTPSPVEKLAGTVFSEHIRLIGDDAGTVSDITITNFPQDNYAVSTSTATVNRTRTRTVLKSALNEDPAFTASGAEQIDETFVRITLAYAANAPVPPALPAPAITSIVQGAWR